MNVGEATRQYQATLEAERATRGEFEGILSAEDELEAAAKETALAREQMVTAWKARA